MILFSLFFSRILNEYDFDDYYQDKDNLAILFHGNNCDKCKEVFLDFEDASFFFRNTTFLTLDCSKNPKLCKKLAVVRYPSLLLIRKSHRAHIVFDKGIKSEKIIDFVMENSCECPFYQYFEHSTINQSNIVSYIKKPCGVIAFYSQKSINSIPFWPVVRNISRVFIEDKSISISTCDCDTHPSLCNKTSDLPVFILYKNGSEIKIDQNTMSETVESINSHCGANRMLNGFSKHISCIDYFTTNKNSPSEFCSKTIYRYKKHGYKTLLKDASFLEHIIESRYGSLSTLNNASRLLDAIRDLFTYNNLPGL